MISDDWGSGPDYHGLFSSRSVAGAIMRLLGYDLRDYHSLTSLSNSDLVRNYCSPGLLAYAHASDYRARKNHY